jgi:hypothetical protein
MEIGHIPKLAPQKAEESQKVKVPIKSGVNAYGAAQSEDSAKISAKARLMLSLRDSYRKLEDEDGKKVVKVEEKLAEGLHKLSSEEIVSSILQGTLFEVV